MNYISIYGLSDPRHSDIRYVGKTVLPLGERLGCHVFHAKTGRAKAPVGTWIRGLLSDGVRPEIILLETAMGDGSREECKWIAELENLVNVHKGGNGRVAGTKALDPQYVSMLGVLSDTQIGERAGIGRLSIARLRKKHGIGRARDFSRNPGGRGANKKLISPELVALIGILTDEEISKRANVSRPTIASHRKKMGLPVSGDKPRSKGEKHYNSKYTEGQATAVIAALQAHIGRLPVGVTQAIAEKTNTSVAFVRGIRKGSGWKHLTQPNT